MAITPDTNLKLLKCNLNLDNSNQLNFATATAQYNYFNSLPKLELQALKYIRKDGVIYYPAHIDSIIEYNYVMYQNHNYTNKWFYAYIVRMEYENENTTRIYIKTDPYQTWQFNLTFMRSFVEREHVNDDTKGKHTVPEGLETGEFISTTLQPVYGGPNEFAYCVATSDPIIKSGELYSTLNEEIPSGLYYIGIDTTNGVRNYIQAFSSTSGYSPDTIYAVFPVPKACWDSSSWIDWNDVIGAGNKINFDPTFSPSPIEVTITRASYIGKAYTPKNNKLFTREFCYLQVNNLNGAIVNYNWEDFNLAVGGTSYKFYIDYTLSVGGSGICFPSDYKNVIASRDGIPLGKYPTGGWKSDAYTNWLTQNAVNLQWDYAKSSIETLVGAGMMATGVGVPLGAGLVGHGLSGILGNIQEKTQHSREPDSGYGSYNTGDVMFQNGWVRLLFSNMTVKDEYAKIIDDFFSMYGYKVNSTKTPNITGRRNWNYVKTIDCNIEGYIPQEDLEEIKGMFNTGVTIWHNPSTFLDYSQNNDII